MKNEKYTPGPWTAHIQTIGEWFAEIKNKNGRHVCKVYIDRDFEEVKNNLIIPQIKDKHTMYDPVGINRLGKDITIVLSGK